MADVMKYFTRPQACLQLFIFMVVLGVSAAIASNPSRSQEKTAAPPAPQVAIPILGDINARVERPEMSGSGTIRFLTEDGFPPFNFLDAAYQPVGFAVDLARDACTRLAIACTIQARRYDLLLDALAEGKGDVVIAAAPLTPELLERFAVTTRYMRFPGRFMAKGAAPAPGAPGFAGKTIGVVAGTAHEAWLTARFPAAPRKTYPDLAAAGAGLIGDEVAYVFGDGFRMSQWLHGARAGNCCQFAGGPYLSDAYFGEGVGFIVRRDDAALLSALNYALQQAWADGRYEELYLRYFPVSFF